ncbi:MAG: hypothetical protein HN927_02145 [Candidatus Marinimicrobia bacterium]|jgi:hypothetical protein|nr:hypothetical protein [Candidatus Neomarinimicrobiota bacterium]MBT5069602.1 hypothetical protein [Candidatus Neomarinimicrobiota bacterium]MBT7083034.1 hypothetical protein [Candidatus Neomarinimicrobiota bacterium]
MIKRIIGIIILLLTCVTLVAQESANIYRVIYLKAKAGQKGQFLAGMKEHTNKFHSKGVSKVRTHEVVSGDKAGWYVRSSGPFTWAEVDKYEADHSSKAHAAHGAKVFGPYIGDRVGPMYWSRRDDFSYNRNTSSKPSKLTRVSFTHLNPLMDGEYRDLRMQIKEAHEKTNSDDSFTVGQLVHGGKMHTYAQFYSLNSWADMASSGPSNASRMNEVFGQGGWGRLMSKGQKIIYKRNDEMRVYMEEYSTR